MNRDDFKGATMHGDAWMRFLRELGPGPYPFTLEEQHRMWHWFLAGWQAKNDQRRELGSKPA